MGLRAEPGGGLMEVVIRNAAPDDYVSAAGIMNQVHQLHAAWRPDIFNPNASPLSPEGFAKAAERGTFFVAEAEGRVVGIMELAFRHTEDPALVSRTVLFIDSMAVDRRYRGMGIGRLFLEKAKQFKDRNHCDGIELQVNVKNQAAYELYVSCGFAAQSITMEWQ